MPSQIVPLSPRAIVDMRHDGAVTIHALAPSPGATVMPRPTSSFPDDSKAFASRLLTIYTLPTDHGNHGQHSSVGAAALRRRACARSRALEFASRTRPRGARAHDPRGR